MEVSQFLTLRKSVELNIANYFMTACLIKMRIQYDQNEGIYFSYLCSLCLYNCIYFSKYFDIILYRVIDLSNFLLRKNYSYVYYAYASTNCIEARSVTLMKGSFIPQCR